MQAEKKTQKTFLILEAQDDQK